jgi:hypothetical protein
VVQETQFLVLFGGNKHYNWPNIKHCKKIIAIFAPSTALVPFWKNLVSNSSTKKGTIWNTQFKLYWCKYGANLMHILVGSLLSMIV